MRKRCSGLSKNPNDQVYFEKGIKVHPSWENNFHQFIADLGPRTSPELTLDRFPNKNGHYEPGNTRWADKKNQAVNRSSTKLLELKGQIYTVSKLSTKFGISENKIRQRLLDGWTVEQAVEFGPDKNVYRSDGRKRRRMLTSNMQAALIADFKSNKFETVQELAKEYGVSVGTIYNILRRKGVIINVK